MELKVDSGGGKKVVAEFEGFTVETDQSVKHGGEALAPDPFGLFLAALGTCAGHYVYSYCEKRKIPIDGITLKQTCNRDEKTKKIDKVRLEIRLPAGFPEKHRGALVRSAELCTVKKQLDPSIEFESFTSTAEG
jgi:ribosomal protein S12 methylthiotransferase accessory factor